MPREGRVRQTTIYVYFLVPNKFINMVISNFIISIEIKFRGQLGLIADPVIEAIAGLEFEDGLRTGVLPRGCWCP